MALEDDIRILSGVALFGDLSGDQLRLLAFGVEMLQLSRDQILYREGDAADCAYVVVAGQIGLSRGREGVDQPAYVGTARAGELLGELALISPAPRSTSAVAAGDAEVMAVPRKLFRRILEEYPEVAAALHARLAAKFQELVRGIEAMAPRFKD